MKYSFIIVAFQAIAIYWFLLANASMIFKHSLLPSHPDPCHQATPMQYPVMTRSLDMYRQVGPWFGYFPNFLSSSCGPCPGCFLNKPCFACPSNSTCQILPETTPCPPVEVCPAPIVCPTPTPCTECTTPPPCPAPPPEVITSCGAGLNTYATAAQSGTILVDQPELDVNIVCIYTFVAYPPFTKIRFRCTEVTPEVIFVMKPANAPVRGIIGFNHTSIGSYLVVNANNVRATNKIGMKLKCDWEGIP